METKISKWGNSLGLRIPQIIAEQAQIYSGSTVELEISDGVIRIKKCQLDLNEMLDKITADNLHGEIDFGEPRGNEIW